MNQIIKRNKAHFFRALVCILISNALAVVLQFYKGDVLDHALAGETLSALRYAVLLLVFILGETLFYFGYRQFGARFVTGCTKQLKRDIFESILRRDYVEYKTLPQGEYIAKYTNEADTIKARRFQMIPLFCEIFIQIIFVSAALFVLDWRIALITIVLLTTPLYIPKLIERRLQKAQNEHIESVEQNLAKVNDWLSGFEIIKNFSFEKSILSKFDSENDLTMEKMLRDSTLGAVSQLITTLISYLSYFIVLVCSSWLVLQGDFSAGDFFVAIGMIDQLSYPLISLAEIIRQLTAIKPACQEMERFIKSEEGAKTGKTLTGLKNNIRYRDVTFAYPGKEPILRDLNFEAQMGRRYLIQGPSGCGKTTAINLLLRYYDVAEGTIEIDGIPISEYRSTYHCMTVVRQDAVLFHDSLRNNLTMYRDISDDKLIEMLNRLGLSKFANRYALDETIAENGANLSGGEKKRICLARALLVGVSKHSFILIKDKGFH